MFTDQTLIFKGYPAVGIPQSTVVIILAICETVWSPWTHESCGGTHSQHVLSNYSSPTSISLSEKLIFLSVVATIHHKEPLTSRLIYAYTLKRCFALTIYGWMWVCRRQNMRLIHMRTFPGFFCAHHSWLLWACTLLVWILHTVW